MSARLGGSVHRARLVAGTALVGALLGACSGPDAGLSSGAPVPATPPVGLATVEARDLTSVVVVAGVTVARPSVTVSVATDGALRQEVETGAVVTAGQRIGSVAGAAVVAPADGVLVSWLVDPGAAVLGDVPLAVVRYVGMAAQVQVPPDLSYRVYSTPTAGAATIDGGPGGVACAIAPLADPPPAEADQPRPWFACLLPAGTRTLPGLGAQVGLATASVLGVPALPVESVLGSAGTGTATRVEGDRRTVVTLTLGVSDGSFVQVLDGLVEGDVVESVAPGLGPASP